MKETHEGSGEAHEKGEGERTRFDVTIDSRICTQTVCVKLRVLLNMNGEHAVGSKREEIDPHAARQSDPLERGSKTPSKLNVAGRWGGREGGRSGGGRHRQRGSR